MKLFFLSQSGGAAVEGLSLRPAGTHAHTEVCPAAQQNEQSEYENLRLRSMFIHE